MVFPIPCLITPAVAKGFVGRHRSGFGVWACQGRRRKGCGSNSSHDFFPHLLPIGNARVAWRGVRRSRQRQVGWVLKPWSGWVFRASGSHLRLPLLILGRTFLAADVSAVAGCEGGGGKRLKVKVRGLWIWEGGGGGNRRRRSSWRSQS